MFSTLGSHLKKKKNALAQRCQWPSCGAKRTQWLKGMPRVVILKDTSDQNDVPLGREMQSDGFLLVGRKSGQGRHPPQHSSPSWRKQLMASYQSQYQFPIVAIHFLYTSPAHMKMLMPCNYVPKDMLRCQVYTCKTDEWFGKWVHCFFASKWHRRLTSCSQWPTVHLSFCLS